MNNIASKTVGAALPSPNQVSLVGKPPPTIQDKIKDMTNTTITPSLAGSLKPVSSIKAAENLRGNGSIVVNSVA
ncbi:MAG: hypothetical protein ORN98_05805 [Alphaproteobacteria bacterium]|nr:hypothetical protein [Alphaproteobacteria bacterium]